MLVLDPSKRISDKDCLTKLVELLNQEKSNKKDS